MSSTEGGIKGIIDNYDTLNSFLQSSADSVSALDACWKQVSSGAANHMAAIKNDGTLWTWGCGCFGRLGNGTEVDRCSPGTVAGGGTTWCQVSSGFAHVAAIKTNGTLWTWGRNDRGELGDGTAVCRSSPGTVAGGGTTWCQVSSTEQQIAAIKTDGTLWTWGGNFGGSLGDGTTVSRCSPGTVAGGGSWCRVSSGSSRTAAIKTDGTLWTWGYNTFGDLGDGTTVSRCSPGTVAAGGTTWCQVAGEAAIKTDGTLWTWGGNGFGKSGDGTNLSRCSPGTVAGGGTTWCQVTGGTSHTAAIKTDGTLWTWGYNAQGRLGEGTIVNRCSPGTVAGGGTTWCRVSFGRNDGAAIKTDGTLWTWGRSYCGELGDGTTVNRCSPGTIVFPTTTSQEFLLLASAIDQISEDRQVSVASTNDLPDLYKKELSNGHIVFAESINAPVISNNECWVGLDGRVLRSDAPTRTLFTWGCNNCGSLGDGTTVGRSSPGTVAGGGTTWCKIAGNVINGMGLKTDGTLWTWGCNAQGQLGDGTTVSRCSPGTIAGSGTNWCDIGITFCALGAIKTDGTIWTWGNGVQLGHNTNTNRCSPGTVAGGGTTWCQVNNAGSSAFAAIKNDGTLWTWGCNAQGQLGDGTAVNRSSPGTVAGGGTTWCQVAGGGASTLAIKTDGTLWTWGCNNNAQLGNGTTVSRCSPGTVAGGGTNWCQVSGSSGNSVSIKTDGTLWTWGSNGQGRLGDGTVVARCSPGTVAGGGTTWCLAKIYPNGDHTLALKTDGTLWTWGRNYQGSLGNGTTVNRCSPGTVAGGGDQWTDVQGASDFSLAIRTS